MPLRKYFPCLSMAALAVCLLPMAAAQPVVASQPVVAAKDVLVDPLPRTAIAEKANGFLAGLSPATSVDKLLSGNDLILDMPGVAQVGIVPVRLVSTVERTDTMWLLSLSAQPQGGQALLASVALQSNTAPDVLLKPYLQHTQSLLLVVRADDKYYGVHREIKIGQPVTGSSMR